MFLTEYKAVLAANPKVGEAIVNDATIRKIYYLIRGRNAWHSTWVQHYYPRCLSTKLMDARDYAEVLRGRGSTFQIIELPALVFETSAGALAITEINTNAPLAGYSVTSTSKDAPHGFSLIEGAKDNYFFPGVQVAPLAMSFEQSSRFWRLRPSPRNSVIALFQEGASFADFEELILPLEVKKSESVGSGYLLNWWPAAGEKQCDPIKAIAAKFEIQHPDIEQKLTK